MAGTGTGTAVLSNELKMPTLGLGTFNFFKPGVGAAVEIALKAGYRLIDCAHFYANEEEIGKALQKCFAEGVVRREDVFITSKLWCTDLYPEEVLGACKRSLENLQLDYLDLYLVHWPVAMAKSAEGKRLSTVTDEEKLGYSEENIKDCWEKMEECVANGFVKSIGISNFSITKTGRLLKTAKIVPAVNQVECYPYFQQGRLHRYCKSKGILMECFCPLGRRGSADIFEDPVVLEIAQNHGVTAAQVCLAFGLHRGLALIPKSMTPSRIHENFKSLEVKLSAEDVKRLEALDKGERQLTGVHVVPSSLDVNEHVWDESEDEKYEFT